MVTASLPPAAHSGSTQQLEATKNQYIAIYASAPYYFPALYARRLFTCIRKHLAGLHSRRCVARSPCSEKHINSRVENACGHLHASPGLHLPVPQSTTSILPLTPDRRMSDPLPCSPPEQGVRLRDNSTVRHAFLLRLIFRVDQHMQLGEFSTWVVQMNETRTHRRSAVMPSGGNS